MNVLSLFDGISCGKVVLEKLGFPIDNYYASEIDKHAIKVSHHNHPDIIRLGDISNWREWDIDFSDIDLILAGSPCQGFSFAGKQLAFDDNRSKLFFVFVDILQHIRQLNPQVKFLLENVKMKKEYLDIISDILNEKPVFINSADFSAQNRQRYYWFNWLIEGFTPKEVKLDDILEPGFYSTRDKSYCIDANYGKGTNFRRYFYCGSRQLVLKNGYTPSNMTKETANNVMHSDGNMWRKLTVGECEKLQTIPVGYVDSVEIPKVEKYKCIGNAWTIDVIAHILDGMDYET